MTTLRIAAIAMAAWVGALVPAGAHAETKGGMSRAVFVERTNPSGARLLEPAQDLRRGDVVVLMVAWDQPAQDGALTVSVSVPRSLAYTSSSRDGLLVSTDGGRRWGRLGSLQHAGRMAAPEDVTNLRWIVPPRSGRITYSARVR